MAEFTGTAGPDNLNGTSGDDQMYGGADDDVLTGGDGDDSLYGEAGGDTLVGGVGDDYLVGREGDDGLDGGAGNDVIRAGAGDDAIQGGAGRDRVEFDIFGVTGVTVDLAKGTATGEGTDTLAGIEDVHGTYRDDVLTGDQYANRLIGDGGADIISGGEGNDEIDADRADRTDIDRVDGGGGDDLVKLGANDVAAGGSGFDALEISLWGNSEGTTIDLSALWGGGTGLNGSGTLTGFERLVGAYGSEADDIIIVGTGADDPDEAQAPSVRGMGGDDRLTGGDDRNWFNGDGGADVLIGLGANDNLSGGSGEDRLEGGDGDDWLDGGAGTDDLIGGAGSDTYGYFFDVDGSPAADSIVEDAAAAGIDKIRVFTDTPLSDAIFAGLRNVEVAEFISTLEAAGPEFVLGVQFQATGIRSVIASANIDASQVTAGLDILIKRPNLRDLTITAGSGDDVFRFDPDSLPPWVQTYRLAGGPGTDTLRFADAGEAHAFFHGSTYHSVFLLSSVEILAVTAGPQAVAVANGPDRVGQAQSYSLTLTDDLFPDGGRLTIDARGLRADLIVGLGSDGELGGTGAAADLIGSDSLVVQTWGLTGTRAITVLAGATADELNGHGGDDRLFGGGGNDVLDGGYRDDLVAGEAGDDILRGGEGHDELDGGSGVDTMHGGSGNDLYVLDNAADKIVELSGIDTVKAAFTYRLPAELEHLVLTGAAPINGYGNDSANGLTGNGAANRLDGGGGADAMAGGGGNDVYVVDDAGDSVVEAAGGGSDTVESRLNYSLPDQVEALVLGGSAVNGTGNGGANAITGTNLANVLNGGGGADTLRGLGGNDVYVVDSAADAVVEMAEMGSDTVRSSASYTLPQYVEALVLTGGGDLRGTGNGLANTITGNGGNNRLDGQAGADSLAGGAGHDIYVVDHPADKVTESGSSGTDTVESGVSYTLPIHFENLVLTGTFGTAGRGNAGANRITGNSGGNLLTGGSGNDVIDGGAGNDQLIGGAGIDSLKGGAGGDRFYFNLTPGAANADKILDFAAADDSLYLLRSAFSRAGANGTLAASAFHLGSAAADAGDRILYDAATGKIFYDADGTGAAAALLFATVAAGTPLTHADFLIYG